MKFREYVKGVGCFSKNYFTLTLYCPNSFFLSFFGTYSPLPSPTTPRRFSEVSATPKLAPPDTLNNAIDVPETSCVEFSTPTAEPIKRRNSTPKQKNTLANPRKKNLSEATSNQCI